MTALKIAGLVAVLMLPLGGCAYDYLQHTDRVGYSAGDAVHANLESETTNPSKRSMWLKGGLGKNGKVTADTAASTPPQ